MAYVDQSLHEFLELVASRAPAPGAGAAAAVTVSLAASLVAMTAEEDVGTEMLELRRSVDALADSDAAAYTAVLEARRAGALDARVWERAVRVPLEIAESAATVARGAATVLATGRPAVRGDAATALLLAEAAARSAAYLVELNVEAGGLDGVLVDRARACVAAAHATARTGGASGLAGDPGQG